MCNTEKYLFARAVTSGTSVFYWWENVSGRCLPCSRCPADQVTIKVLMMIVLIVMLTEWDQLDGALLKLILPFQSNFHQDR